MHSRFLFRVVGVVYINVSWRRCISNPFILIFHKVSVTICEQNRKTIARAAALMFSIRFPKPINDVQNVKVKDNVTLLSESHELSPYISFAYALSYLEYRKINNITSYLWKLHSSRLFKRYLNIKSNVLKRHSSSVNVFVPSTARLLGTWREFVATGKLRGSSST